MPFSAPILIDVGDGTLIVPPPAIQPAPGPPPPPPPPPPPVSPPPSSPAAPPGPAAPTSAQPILQPGIAYVDLGDVLGPSQLMPAPPVTTSPLGPQGPPPPLGGPVEGTDDPAVIGRLLAGYDPDLSDLPGWELEDPFGERFLANVNPPLKGGGALSAIAQAGADYGVDVRAIVADALHEGAGGGIGDGGTSYGPFQLHQGGALPSTFSGRPRSDPVVNAWAWSENGIRYAVRAMATAKPSAKGLVGHQAVYAIVYGFERPADKAGAYKTRAAEYDKLVKLGSGWPSYASPLFKGPQAGGAVDSTPIVAVAGPADRPAGFEVKWRDLVDVYAVDVPKASDRIESFRDTLIGVFR